MRTTLTGTMGSSSTATVDRGTPNSTSFREVTTSAVEKPTWGEELLEEGEEGVMLTL